MDSSLRFLSENPLAAAETEHLEPLPINCSQVKGSFATVTQHGHYTADRYGLPTLSSLLLRMLRAGEKGYKCLESRQTLYILIYTW